ncbi:MAG TPA: nucleoside-diphosphate kinase [Chloroflexota bacterium]|nr:nucleoside-diphosphate kinase [Chloroflexota bacterium]
MHQRTFVMIKPDGVKRGLVGEIITTFEKAGLKITKLQMMLPSPKIVEQHYPNSDEWFQAAGEKALQGYTDAGLDPVKDFGTDSPIIIGHNIKKWLVEFLCSGEVVIMVAEGNLAIPNVRRLCGNTLPTHADPASIRGRYSIDSPDLSFAEQRPVLNLVHASGNEHEAEFEIRLWFGD